MGASDQSFTLHSYIKHRPAAVRPDLTHSAPLQAGLLNYHQNGEEGDAVCLSVSQIDH
ncbi:hypothetical protein CUMW_066760 [Citrus unshiu]|nr:hypothetical protein CUMW_066760 [Citrus unshiu]GAY42427.1 hypothetical protein CUMW_066760 [Citrus unshiu]